MSSKISWNKFKFGRNTEPAHVFGLVQLGALFVILLLTQETPLVRCDTKEFDWSELGVSLANAKSSLGGNPATNNLRILVSPQRRMTKNSYEFEYSNNSQPTSGETTSYIVPGSGSSYLTQSALSPNHSGHSSAYSALSASLASLKNRLNVRGVTLTSLPDGSSQSSLYPNTAYGSSLIIDTTQQHSSGSQGASQPTYLSVASQQDQQSAGYPGSTSQGNDNNKTIVLAIPAKINFLTGIKQQQQQQQQTQQLQQQQSQQPQTQQLTVIQSSSNEQQPRAEYTNKQQIGVITGHEGGVDQSTAQASPATDQEHHQYVIVNSPPQGADYHSHSVAANLNPAVISSVNGQIYSSPPVYQAAVQPVASVGPYTMKYVPAYQPTATIQQPTVQKVYSVIEPYQQQQQQQQQQQEQQQQQQQQQPIYEPQPVDQPPPGMNRYTSSCLDTCNSADPRWRKYTVSKYKACCSRSAQYDSSLEQPSADKISEVSSKYSDDAYYGYLYRKSRSRRSRKTRERNRYNYSRYQPTASAQPDEEGSSIGEPGSSADSAGGSMGTSNGRSYPQETSSYMKYYRGRNYPSADTGRDSDPASGKYSTKEQRSYRRGRSRDLEALPEPQPSADLNEDQEGPSNMRESARGASASASASSSSGGYGSSDYTVEAGRYPPESPRQPQNEEEDTPTRGGTYDASDETTDSESAKGADSDYSSVDSTPETINSEDSGPEPETSAAYKYPVNNSRRRRQNNKNRRKSNKNSKSYKKNRKNKLSKPEYQTSLANNGTDFDSVQQGDYHHNQEVSANYNDEDQSNSAKESNSNDSQEADKDAMVVKYKASINETTVANLSKTTMHLKEILSMLEKKAQWRANESTVATVAANQASLPITSTPAPTTTTTTNSLYPLSSFFGGGSQYSSSFPNEYLPSELNLKSPYRYESSSSLGSGLPLSSSFGSLGSDSLSSALSSYPGHSFGLNSGKPMTLPNGHHPRKRRVNKNNRYNDLMFPKTHGLSMSPSLLHAATKNRFLSPSYYPTLQHPYLYRGSSSSITNAYPYKSMNKSPYSSLFSGPVSSKLAAATSAVGLYNDESRLHGMGGGYDPLANVASSLRPSTAMRLRTKPFVFQPHVLPIYSRHTILTQPVDVKA